MDPRAVRPTPVVGLPPRTRNPRHVVATVALAWALAPPAFAEPTVPDGGAPDAAPAAPDAGVPALTPEEQKQLEKALQEDQATRQRSKAAAVPPAGGPPAATPSPAGAGGITSAFGRAVQSLNPDISAIVDFTGAFYHGPFVKSGDDPADTGANLQEVELAFQAIVDPYFRADVFLTIPNLRGVEVEEAFLTTTSLPGSLQLRAGVFRAPFGRQNTQHLHLQNFTRRPQMNALFLGPDGLRSPGGELSWLAPLPFYLLVTGAVFSVAPPAEPGILESFGGGDRSDLTYLGNLRTFVPFGENTSLLFGLSFASGKTSQLLATSPQPVFATAFRSFVYGADAYLKWKPANVAQTYMSLAWTTEFYLRHVPDDSLLDGALYSQLVWQIARRWYFGVRGELDGIPSSAAVPRQYAGAGSITWALSEFSRVRLYGEARYTPDAAEDVSWATMLQFEVAIGAHGAHPY